MPKSKKPRVKRATPKTDQKPAWYQELKGASGQEGARPSKAGKKSQNKSA